MMLDVLFLLRFTFRFRKFLIPYLSKWKGGSNQQPLNREAGKRTTALPSLANN